MHSKGKYKQGKKDNPQNGKKIIFSISGTGRTGQLHVKE